MSAKKPFYISFNAAEFALLTEVCTHEELALYFVLKKMSSFKNGSVGNFGAPMTYESLARSISRPSSQGRASVNYDKKHAHRLMQSLEAKMLVSDIDPKDRLTCKLPMSLLHFGGDKEATSQAALLLALAGKLPQMRVAETAESEAVPDFPGDSLKAVSSDSNDSSGQSDSLPQYLHSSFNSPATPHEAQGVRTPSGIGDAIHPASLPLELGKAKQPQSEMAQAIERHLVADGRFEWPSAKLSRENYERWAKLPGFDLEKLHAAISLMCQEDSPLGFNPIELSKFVMDVCAPARRGRPPKTGKHHNAANGRVIL